jgi:hypothetical protein
MTTITTISPSDSTNCNFSTTNISSRVEHAEYSLSSTNTSQSSYRKSYIAWDKLERANKPDNYTEKTRYLSKNAKALLSVVYQKLKKQPVLLLNHKYISTITNSGSRQNQRIIQEIKDVVDVSYKRGITELNGKKYKNSYEFKLKNNTIDESIQRTKMSDKNASSTIYRENNNIKIRSRANFVKNSSNSFSIEENPNTEIDNEINNKIEGQGDETLKTEVASGKENNITCNTNITPYNANGFLGSGKFLFEILDHLTDEMCSQIRARCGKNYTDKAIREIAKSVSRSKKGAKAFFYHIKGFIAYLSKILTFEKRDPVKISGTNYYITANQTSDEQVMRKQEKYLTDIEYSLQVSPEWHLKKKLAAILERSKAYNFLTSYKSLETLEGRAVITLNSHIQLSELDKDLILKQIQATHEKIDDAGNYQPVESLEIITPGKPTALNASAQKDQVFPKREGVWGEIRETFASYFGSEGDAIDKSWTSKLEAKIEESSNTIQLQAPSAFMRDWINSNYLSMIERASRENNVKLKAIT